MYGKKQKSGKKNSEAVETILGEGAVFEGNISCEGSMKVEGTLKGNVKADHTLVVGPNGSITGDINAGGVIIFGEVNGKIDSGSLEIKSTGRITGEVRNERPRATDGLGRPGADRLLLQAVSPSGGRVSVRRRGREQAP